MQRQHLLLVREDTLAQVPLYFLARHGIDHTSPFERLVERVLSIAQTHELLVAQDVLRQFEVGNLVICEVVIDDKPDIRGIVLVVLALPDIFQAMDGQAVLLFVVPRIGDAADLCQTVDFFWRIIVDVVSEAHLRGYEDVDAHLTFLLVAV